ncbi:MAG TPA: four-carbon acid sugar kinase family protein [Rhodopila sp.]
MTIVRLLADDLTGALDTAAEFVALAGEMPVVWALDGQMKLQGSAGLDSGTRELGASAAVVAVGGLLGLLEGADIAFKKIDSLLRGPALDEIAACARAGLWRSCVLAPAFPYQGRVTRAARQYARSAEEWTAVSADLVAGLRARGVPAVNGTADVDLPSGVSVFDAESDADLRRVVWTVRRCTEGILWIGTGGLAQALAAGHGQPAPKPLPRPVLGVFGSDQSVTAGQLAACEEHWLDIEAEAIDAIPGRLDKAGLALVSFRLPLATPRAMAAARIAAGIKRLIDRVDPPGTVVVAGGETLRSLCDAACATNLLVQGRLVPGVPRSIIQGGPWHGVTVVSKSGAFGHPALLRELILERTDP